MNHTAFFQHIQAGDLCGAYLLHGEEEYVKEQALVSLFSIIDPVAKDLNIQIFDDANPQKIIEACEMLPFFSDRRIIVCRFLPQGEAWEKINAYLPSMPSSSLLVFITRGTANGTLGITKSMKASEHLITFSTLEENEAVKWVCQQAQKYPVHITLPSARFLVQVVGCSLSELGNELTKAAGYAGEGNEITVEIIQKAVTKNIEYSVFAMVDYFVCGKTADGLRALSSLLEGQSAFSIAALLAGRFKLMLQAKLLALKGLNKNEVAAKLDAKPFAAKSAYDAAKRYSVEKLEQNIISFSEVGYKQISGQMKDKEALELAVLNCVP